MPTKLFFATVLLVTTLGQPAPATAARKTVIKLGTLAPDGSAWHLILQDMGQRWKQASDGRVELRIYPGGRAGDEPDMVRKIRIGQLHAAALTVAGLATVSNGPQVLSVPKLFDSYAELDHVRGELGPELEADLRRQGFIVLDWADAGWIRFLATGPVQAPEDLRRMKLFVWAGAQETLDIWKAFGFHPVPLAATDIQTGLRTGLIDAAPMTAIAALASQTFTVANHMVDVRWAPLAGAVVVSESAWLRVPADVRPELVRIARDAGERLRTEIRALDDAAVGAMRARGLVVHDVDAELDDRWRRLAETAYPRIRGAVVPAELFDRAIELRDRYRSAAPHTMTP